MADYISKDMALRIDNASGTLTSISSQVNSQALQAGMTILDNTGIGDTAHTTVTGLGAQAVIPLSGFVNSTIEAILGPILNGTTKTKTVEFKVAAGKFFNGEFWPGAIEFSGSPDTIEAWSMTLTAQTGASINRTSKAL
jgi:hypothetical protein